MLKKLLPILLGLFAMPLYAAHIVGGDFYYECLGNDNYRITLKIYRDCSNNGPNVADFDNPAFIGIYDAAGNLIDQIDAFNSTPVNIPPVTNNPCLQAPPNVCVEEGTYTFDRIFTPASGGYDIVYVRCCRNGTINNLVDPGATGATYITHIPDPALATCNSSPQFNDFPPIVICANEPLVFDHSATDPDGDQLVYELCQPFHGADDVDPKPVPSNPLGSLQGVSYSGGFSATNPLLANPPLTIDPQTGLLTGTPIQQGQYVVGICVNEYRNGVLVGTTRRDFQFNVTNCQVNVQARIPVIDTTGAGALGVAGIYQRECSDFNVNFVNQSINGTTYFWDFGDTSTLADTSLAFQPSYTYPDTGDYIVELIVNEGFPCEARTKVIVKVYPTFSSDFDHTEVCLGELTVFTDQSTSTFNDVMAWNWDYGDNSPDGTQQNVQHVYQNPGTYTVQLTSETVKGCIDNHTASVVVHDVPEADFSYTPTCINTPVDFTDLTSIQIDGISTWQWSSNGNTFSTDQNPTETFPNLGAFDIQLITTSDFGCVDSVVKTVTVHPLPTITTSSDLTLCVGDIGQLSATGGVQYTWSPTTGLSDPNSATTDVEAITTTTYTVNVVDANQCQDDASIFVDVKPLPAVNAGADDYVCMGDSYQLQGSGGGAFQWSPANLVSDPAIANPTTTPLDTTTFVLQITSIDGCINRDSVTISVQFPIVPTVTNDFEMCLNDVVQLEATGGLFYEWTPPTGLSDPASATPDASPTVDTEYRVVISNNCFSDTVDVEIVVNPLPFVDAGVDDSIIRDEFTFLDGTGGLEQLWSPPDGLDDPADPATQASPFNTTDYVLTVTDGNGCKNSDTVRVYVVVINALVVPSAFTPNRDGVNDIFRIIKHRNIAELHEFKVFNRWGQIVFETANLNWGWDGTYQEEPQDIGTYMYIIRATNRDGEQILRHGDVTLIR